MDFKNITVEKIKEACDTFIKKQQRAYDQVASQSDSNLSFKTIMQPLIDADNETSYECCIVSNMSNFHTDKSVRDASVEGKKRLSDFGINASMRQDVYNTFKLYYDSTYNSEKDSLTHEEQRLVEKTNRSYKRNGLHLNNPTIQELKKKINKLCIEFRNNINEDTTSFTKSKEELDGLPESWFHASKLVNESKEQYRVTLKYPDYFPIMKQCNNEETRKQMYLAYSSRCATTNGPLFDEIVFLRDQLSRTLGYKCYADYNLEVKMAQNSQYVMTFLDDLIGGFKGLISKEYDEITHFARALRGDPHYLLKKWDLQYYTRIYKETEFRVDMEVIRQYFPLKHVVSGMFKIYENLLNLKFKERLTDNKWHDSVRLFEVFDATSSQQIGSFYLDMYPREGKYGHAAIFPFITGCNGRLPVATMACNFPEHECLQFSDTVTLFHEFGHVMHHICSKAQLAEFSGFSVEGDFIEAPSQMLEYWCYESDALNILSSHKVTGAPLPQELIDKLDKMELADTGFANRRQLVFGKFDMLVHSMNYDAPSDVKSKELFNKIDHQLMLMQSPPETNFVASFGHLAGGYEAGYYGYMMSETYASDMFYTKFKGHVTNPIVGMEYRQKILEPGSTKDAIDLLKDFLGREPNNKAFLFDKGLTSYE